MNNCSSRVDVNYYTSKYGLDFCNKKAAIEHYIKKGKQKGYFPNRESEINYKKIMNFDPEYYKRKYSIIGDNKTAVRHWKLYGCKNQNFINHCEELGVGVHNPIICKCKIKSFDVDKKDTDSNETYTTQITESVDTTDINTYTDRDKYIFSDKNTNFCTKSKSRSKSISKVRSKGRSKSTSNNSYVPPTTRTFNISPKNNIKTYDSTNSTNYYPSYDKKQTKNSYIKDDVIIQSSDIQSSSCDCSECVGKNKINLSINFDERSGINSECTEKNIISVNVEPINISKNSICDAKCISELTKFRTNARYLQMNELKQNEKNVKNQNHDRFQQTDTYTSHIPEISQRTDRHRCQRTDTDTDTSQWTDRDRERSQLTDRERYEQTDRERSQQSNRSEMTERSDLSLTSQKTKMSERETDTYTETYSFDSEFIDNSYFLSSQYQSSTDKSSNECKKNDNNISKHIMNNDDDSINHNLNNGKKSAKQSVINTRQNDIIDHNLIFNIHMDITFQNGAGTLRNIFLGFIYTLFNNKFIKIHLNNKILKLIFIYRCL